ncbi:RimJ/RimL family protein N-acetyltransferase [Luteibacter sp. Sphag1AF]|uniref:GNAT family N-acetyltransferase n=1 Tax=Luteibacter sp. Sphag1AF TaxID=2587031 RepID=UPI00161449DB|nr:GNAT family N-acetyltransferase [Luteibacter sp. Sphag1AF]MBB3228631.1 RimJ/RimL family protein N-acetyltransferase [Luteibacter sp. Sphag1AF]
MITSPRLQLRPWRPGDLDDLVALNSDPQVFCWLGGPGLIDGSVAALARYQVQFAANGYGVFHVADHAGRFLGLAGLQPVGEGLPTYPATEAVWRFGSAYWWNGFAFEAVTAVLDALPPQAPDALIAAIADPNLRSARLAERLGFVHAPEADYLHPDASLEAALRPHRVFRLARNRPDL